METKLSAPAPARTTGGGDRAGSAARSGCYAGRRRMLSRGVIGLHPLLHPGRRRARRVRRRHARRDAGPRAHRPPTPGSRRRTHSSPPRPACTRGSPSPGSAKDCSAVRDSCWRSSHGVGTLLIGGAGDFIDINPADYGGELLVDTGCIVAWDQNIRTASSRRPAQPSGRHERDVRRRGPHPRDVRGQRPRDPAVMTLDGLAKALAKTPAPVTRRPAPASAASSAAARTDEEFGQVRSGRGLRLVPFHGLPARRPA